MEYTYEKVQAPCLVYYYSGSVFSYKLHNIVGFWFVEMTISTKQAYYVS